MTKEEKAAKNREHQRRWRKRHKARLPQIRKRQEQARVLRELGLSLDFTEKRSDAI